MQTIWRRAVSGIALLVLTGCATAPPYIAPPGNPSQRILFIGNSYTFYNGGLDRILMQIAQQRGQPIACIASTSSGKSLEWHWNKGAALQVMAATDPDWVVLQDFSSQPVKKRASMFEYARRLDSGIHRAGAKTALYMTWARRNEPRNWRTIADAYAELGRQIGATVVPCGLAWQRSMNLRPDIKLYRGDNSHPTAEGSYLNACCFYIALVGDDPRGLPPLTIFEEVWRPRKLSEDVTRFLQQVAWETCASQPGLLPASTQAMPTS